MRSILDSPLGAMRQQRGAVHQQRAGSRNMDTQAVEHSKPMRIKITPIVQIAIGEPARSPDQRHGMAKAKHDDAVLDRREGEASDLVLDHEHAGDPQLEAGELIDRHRQIGEAAQRTTVIENPKPHESGFRAQSVADFEGFCS